MSERTRKIAASLGAKLVGPVPKVGGGAFEMATQRIDDCKG